jgi:Cu2+-exporting ATPase
VVLYSDLPKALFGWEAPTFGIRNLGSGILLVLGSIVFFYGGWVFLAGAWRELKAKLPGMMTLIGLAISAAYIYSVLVILLGRGGDLFWELTTLITVMLLGHWMEMKAVGGAQSALKELSKLLPDTAEVILPKSEIRNSKLETKIVPISELKAGDIVFVRPGGKIAADGVVIEGRSDVNEAMMTGESKPVLKNVDSEVVAGAINGEGSLKIKVTKIGEHTFLAGVMRLVEEAQASKSKLQILSDRAAFYLTIIAVAGGTLTFAVWLIFGAGFAFAIERLVAVLVIACPHALGLAVPLVASISTTMAARGGLLVRQRLALEAARKIDIVLFDKTGTLTKGEYGVDAIIPNSQLLISNEELLRLAASVDAHSEHFIAKAIVKKAREDGVPLSEVKDFSRIPGKGTKGMINGSLLFVGGEAILEHTGAAVPESFRKEISEESKSGKTIIYVVRNKEFIGVFSLADLLREESREAIKDLKNLGLKVVMITGDSEEVAKWVAGELGIDEYFARVLPQEKSEIIKKLQEGEATPTFQSGSRPPTKRRSVGMVGDGINDAPALTQADLGIAIGAGTNVAIESAGIILVKNDPRDIVRIIKLSRATYSKMIQNLFWATGYNVVALPLAAGVLVSQGILLQPALAALFMSLSTVIVAVNAVLLRRRRL